MTSFPHRYRSADEARSRRLLERAPSFVWKRFADGVELKARLFAPEGHNANAFLPAVVFFYGGMWTMEYDEEFVSWATHLSHRGIVSILPEFRTHSRFDVMAEDIIQDAKDAWEWVHRNAPGLGIDQDLITLAGSDSGGLMALNAAMAPLIEKRRWWKPGSRDILPLMPASVAILRGVIDTDAPEARSLNVQAEVNDPESINPCALLRRHLPPLFCAHGMMDPLLDFELREWFCNEWRRLDNEAELVLCQEADHTITHFHVNPAVFERVLISWESFMVHHGIWPDSVCEQHFLMA